MGLNTENDMKKRAILKGLMVLVAMLTAHQGFAQEQTHTERVDMNTGLVVWTGSLAEEVANTDKFFFLVEFKDQLNVNDKELYVGARGDYGVQGILSSVGMRMQLVSPETAPITLSNNQPTPLYYQFVSRIENSSSDPWLGDRMGIDNENDANVSIYLDRSKNRNMYNNDQNNCNNFPNWKLNFVQSYKDNIRYKGEPTSKRVNVNTYTIQNVETQSKNNWRYNGNYKPTYITVKNGKLVSTFNASEATKWIIVSEDDFEDAMLDVTWGEVDLGVFVMDATFGRDNKDGKYWEWSKDGEGNPAQEVNGKTPDGMQLTGDNIHWHQRNQDLMINGVMLAEGEHQVRHQDGNNVWFTYETERETIGRNVAGTGNDVDHNYCRQNFAQYYAAEIYNEKNSLTQTLHGANIPNLVDGLYKLTAQALYYDNGSGTTNNGVSYFIVKREVLDDNGNVIEDETTEERMPVKPIMNESLGSTIKTMSGVSAGYVFNNNENAYLLTTFVEISGNVRLTIGIEQKEAVGWTVIGNVHLFAHGKQALMIDEDWGETSTMTYKEGDIWYNGATGNPYSMAKWYDNYDYPSTVYYQRTFKVGGWNTICMPLSLTGRQVRQAFGDDAKVCAFIGQMDNDPDGCILFSRALDLDKDENMNVTVIEAGWPYIIYVSKEPQRKVPEGSTYIEVEVGNGLQNHTVRIDGDCYIIPGVIKGQYNKYHTGSEGNYVLYDPKDVKPNGQTYQDEMYEGGVAPYPKATYSSDIHFKGSFYHEVISTSSIHGSENSGGRNDYWVITRGDMYHLTGARSWNIWATYAYLYRPVGTASSKELTFAIDDGTGIQDIATHIEGLYFDNGQNVEDNDVYTLSGTKVGKGTLDTLPKGIYILNGRKYVKK